jgi:hypothetical protein
MTPREPQRRNAGVSHALGYFSLYRGFMPIRLGLLGRGWGFVLLRRLVSQHPQGLVDRPWRVVVQI